MSGVVCVVAGMGGLVDAVVDYDACCGEFETLKLTIRVNTRFCKVAFCQQDKITDRLITQIVKKITTNSDILNRILSMTLAHSKHWCTNMFRPRDTYNFQWYRRIWGILTPCKLNPSLVAITADPWEAHIWILQQSSMPLPDNYGQVTLWLPAEDGKWWK